MKTRRLNHVESHSYGLHSLLSQFQHYEIKRLMSVRELNNITNSVEEFFAYQHYYIFLLPYRHWEIRFAKGVGGYTS